MKLHPYSWYVKKEENGGSINGVRTWPFRVFSNLRGFDRVSFSTYKEAEAHANYLNDLEQWDKYYPLKSLNT